MVAFRRRPQWLVELAPLFALCQAPACCYGSPLALTPESVVTDALKLANLADEDTLLDVGCGDGGVVLTAAATKRVHAGTCVYLFTRNYCKLVLTEDVCFQWAWMRIQHASCSAVGTKTQPTTLWTAARYYGFVRTFHAGRARISPRLGRVPGWLCTCTWEFPTWRDCRARC
jgi:hypothetical protein